MAKALCRGSKTIKQVSVKHWGIINKKMWAEPVLAMDVDGLAQVGVGVSLYEIDDPENIVQTYFWGESPIDIIASWRGVLIVEMLDSIEHSTLANAYYAGKRNGLSRNEQSALKIRRMIGEEAYDLLMRNHIPADVIDEFMKIARNDGWIATWPIAEEVKARTLLWRDEFAEVEIKHPQPILHWIENTFFHA